MNNTPTHGENEQEPQFDLILLRLISCVSAEHAIRIWNGSLGLGSGDTAIGSDKYCKARFNTEAQKRARVNGRFSPNNLACNPTVHPNPSTLSPLQTLKP